MFMIISSTAMLLHLLLFIQSAHGANWLPEGRVPTPTSQPQKRFAVFLRYCYKFRLGAIVLPPNPSTIFSKIPIEWINAENQTIAASARKFDSRFDRMSNSDTQSFWSELCPYLPGYMYDPQFMLRVSLVSQTCAAVDAQLSQSAYSGSSVPMGTVPFPSSAGSTSTSSSGLTQPSTIWPQDLVSILVMAGNATTIEDSDSVFALDPLVTAILRARGDGTSPTPIDLNNSNLVKSILAQLNENWSSQQLTSFWQAYCTSRSLLLRQAAAIIMSSSRTNALPAFSFPIGILVMTVVWRFL